MICTSNILIAIFVFIVTYAKNIYSDTKTNTNHLNNYKLKFFAEQITTNCMHKIIITHILIKMEKKHLFSFFTRALPKQHHYFPKRSKRLTIQSIHIDL